MVLVPYSYLKEDLLPMYVLHIMFEIGISYLKYSLSLYSVMSHFELWNHQVTDSGCRNESVWYKSEKKLMLHCNEWYHENM